MVRQSGETLRVAGADRLGGRGALSFEQQFRHGLAGDEAVDQPTVHRALHGAQTKYGQAYSHPDANRGSQVFRAAVPDPTAWLFVNPSCNWRRSVMPGPCLSASTVRGPFLRCTMRWQLAQRTAKSVLGSRDTGTSSGSSLSGVRWCASM